MTAACGNCCETVEVANCFFGIMDCPSCGAEIDIQKRIRKLNALEADLEDEIEDDDDLIGDDDLLGLEEIDPEDL